MSSNNMLTLGCGFGADIVDFDETRVWIWELIAPGSEKPWTIVLNVMAFSEDIKLIVPFWHIYENWVIIGLNNGLLPIWLSTFHKIQGCRLREETLCLYFNHTWVIAEEITSIANAR